MLLPAIVKTILLYGGLLIAGVSLILFSVLRDQKNARQANAGNLPEANVVGRSRPQLLRWAPWPVLAVGLLLTYASCKQTTDVIVVSDDGSTVSATRKVRLFGASDYKLAPGQTVQDWMTNPTWVVNESSRVVKIKTVHYGRALGFGNEPTIIPPGTAGAFSAIEHVGPSDTPPTQVEVKHKLGMDMRNWLVWD